MLSRRHFIKNSALALPAFSLAGFLLSSCRKNMVPPKGNAPRICIIGAGIAGLEAAKRLHEEFHYDVEILEAGDRIGGRISSDENAFGAFNVELGASAVYGESNKWYNMMQKGDLVRITPETASSYYINGNQYNKSEISTDQDYLLMQQKLLEMNDFTATSDISVAQYIEMQGVPEKVKFIFKEISEEMIGTSINRASLKLNQDESLGKMYDFKYLPQQDSFYKILLNEYGNILPFVNTNTAVRKIDYSGDGVIITDVNQVVRKYEKVIITVPLSILKRNSSLSNSLEFSPELPEHKKQAMEKLGMDSGVRIILKLNKKFWDHDAKTLYTNCSIGKYEIIQEDLISNQFIIAATVSGEMAENNLDLKSEAEIIQMIKDEWTQNIGGFAANAITNYKIKFWSKDPYIRGTFSYHKLGGDSNTRRDLASPVADKLFFAGEACHQENKSGTINGAMDTAHVAVQDIVSLYP